MYRNEIEIGTPMGVGTHGRCVRWIYIGYHQLPDARTVRPYIADLNSAVYDILAWGASA